METPVQTIKDVLKKNLYSIEPVSYEVDKRILSLAYSPGVGAPCLDI